MQDTSTAYLKYAVLSVDGGIVTTTPLPVGVGRLVHFVNPQNEKSLIPGLVAFSSIKKTTVFVLGLGKSVTTSSFIILASTSKNASQLGEFLIKVDLSVFLGQVIDIFGNSISGVNTYIFDLPKPLNGISDRLNVSRPLITGTKIIDCLFPIGLGQRQLIIGDRYTGKTTVAVDAIIAQKETSMKCIYVSIGQKKSSIKRLLSSLSKTGALFYTTIVSADSSEPAALQFLAPYTGCSLAEMFSILGGDSLVVYDDLSKHAVAYRQMALLLRKSPGRDAFPSDIFYLHSNLLERAGQFFSGSLTALPIVETLARDVSAFVPTNVISITDGQLFLDSSYFNRGVLPAINIGLSVSRVGSKSQFPPMAYMAKWFIQKIVEFRNLESLLSFSSDADTTTTKKVKFGLRLSKFLCQPKSSPISSSHQALLFALVYKGALSQIALEYVDCFSDFVIRWTSEFLYYKYSNSEIKYYSFNNVWYFNLSSKTFMEEPLFAYFYIYLITLFKKYITTPKKKWWD